MDFRCWRAAVELREEDAVRLFVRVDPTTTAMAGSDGRRLYSERINKPWPTKISGFRNGKGEK
jgi:hypothetical protein